MTLERPLRRFRPALALVAALALSLGACSGGDDADATPTPAPPDPAAILAEAADRTAALKTFHFVLSHEKGATEIVLDLDMKRAEGDVIAPDRLKAKVKAEVIRLGGADVEVEIVAVGEDAKVQNPFNKRQWLDIPGKNPIDEIFDPAAGSRAALRAVRSPRIAGEEEIGGAVVWRIEGEIDAGALSDFAKVAEAGYVVKGIVWIGKADGLMRKVRLEGPLGLGDDKEVVRILELSRFDEPISIELP